jgi:hypothetical protein
MILRCCCSNFCHDLDQLHRSGIRYLDRLCAVANPKVYCRFTGVSVQRRRPIAAHRLWPPDYSCWGLPPEFLCRQLIVYTSERHLDGVDDGTPKAPLSKRACQSQVMGCLFFTGEATVLCNDCRGRRNGMVASSIFGILGHIVLPGNLFSSRLP